MNSTPAPTSVADDDGVSSTPPSSPPSANMSDKDTDSVSDRMLAEERHMEEEAKRDEEESAKRSREWTRASQPQQKGQFNKLLHLVEQSKVFATIMQQRMQQEESKRQQRSEAEKKKLAKQEAQAEKSVENSQRKSTREVNLQAAGTSEKGTQVQTSKKGKQLPSRGTAKPKKSEINGSISSWLKKETLSSKSGGMTVVEAVAEAAEEHDANSGQFGAQNLRSDSQPKAVTGGIMRSYQLEGLHWLRSLYENGLNGILADEMGLGKTIQTISFLAFLREMESYGPFLVVAPLSTLSNWIDEFAKWTPTIKTVLYHGSPADRARIRATRLKHPGTEQFPIVCTSYEICMNDRMFLSQYGWKFIIIDEGHRLKNLNCRLIKELKQYRSANRLLITGTPLQNNLAELWSLLNFLMPEVFDTLDNFESFFDFSAVLEKGGHKEIIAKEQKSNLISSLHAILKPFLLRRVKTDVETELPKKREYIIYAPLTSTQKELYKQILEGNSRAYLEEQAIHRILEESGAKAKNPRGGLKRKGGETSSTPISNKSLKSSRASTPGSLRSTRKATKGKAYEEVSDSQYFKQMEESSESEETDDEDQAEQERAKTVALAKREIANKKLQNPVMQLRLACNSPHNFYWPWSDSETPDSSLVTASGKMLILDRLVPYLFDKGHKVLIFSQFKTQLDILEDWASLQNGWSVCRIDGAVAQDDRRQQIKDFNTNEDVRLFLLSTRAGGQGINLAAADTVILFDSDWNPQQDLQAQDRAHRIGQTRPVIVYRLATKGTIEQTLLEKADGKRRLEKLVIRKGKFKSLRGGGGGAEDSMDELAKILEQDDFEGYDPGQGILSEEDLALLTDRSEAAYARAERGEDERNLFRAVETRKDGGVLEGMTTQ